MKNNKHYTFKELFPNEFINKMYEPQSREFNMYYSKMYKEVLGNLLDNYQHRVEMLNAKTDQAFKLKSEIEKYKIVGRTIFEKDDRELFTVSNNLPTFGHVDEYDKERVKFLSSFLKEEHRMWSRREKEVDIIEEYLSKLNYIWFSLKIANDGDGYNSYNDVLLKASNRFKELENQLKTLEDYSETIKA